MVLGAGPPLTSVDICLGEVGRAPAEHLLLAINGEPTHGVHTVPCRLVVRGSSVPGAARPARGHGPTASSQEPTVSSQGPAGGEA